MLTIEPLPRSTIDGSTARQVWNAAVRSVAMTSSQSAGVDLEERPDLRPAGVVDEAVDPAEALDDAARPAPPPGAPSREVGVERLGLGAGRADPGERLLGAASASWW